MPLAYFDLDGLRVSTTLCRLPQHRDFDVLTSMFMVTTTIGCQKADKPCRWQKQHRTAMAGRRRILDHRPHRPNSVSLRDVQAPGKLPTWTNCID
jgi:hypothetical protein